MKPTIFEQEIGLRIVKQVCVRKRQTFVIRLNQFYIMMCCILVWNYCYF